MSSDSRFVQIALETLFSGRFAVWYRKGGLSMTQTERRRFLLSRLLAEAPEYRQLAVPDDAAGQKQLLRALLNVRPPRDASPEFLQVQDEYLRAELAQKGVTVLESLTPAARCGEAALYLWQGDITTLQCDAIVNAANSGMTGCYVPGHRCIDNCIHTFAGVQLRSACARLMAKQGHEEPTGQAKLTPAFNLPCRYVLHTVGPIVTGRVTARDRALLASCYCACLTKAAESGLESIAFCCISTGVFCFPNEDAAEIAVQTVKEFLQTPTTIKKVIFNVFKDLDKEIYTRLLTA